MNDELPSFFGATEKLHEELVQIPRDLRGTRARCVHTAAYMELAAKKEIEFAQTYAQRYAWLIGSVSLSIGTVVGFLLRGVG